MLVPTEGMVRKRIVAVLMVLILAACTLHTGPAPQPLLPADCRTSAQITGTWTSAGASQLGPARSKYVFGCDCIVDVTSALLWARIGGKFRYSVAADTITVEQNRPAAVRFTRDGNKLLLVWPGGDRESLTLDQPSDCSNASK
jgi:hypothetical protein